MLDFLGDQRERCTGCEACASACDPAAILMDEDAEGFRYPRIDDDTCIACGACDTACPVVAGIPARPAMLAPTVHAVRALDDSLRSRSSSGGVFSLLAQHTLMRGGVVVGARFEESLQLAHALVDDPEDLGPLRGSKYVQSRMRRVYRDVMTRLERGQRVLFVGTPCQVAGLHAYLQREHDGLLTCDLVCHGVPSGAVFHSYLRWLERDHGAPVRNFSFRGKQDGWKRSRVVAEFENGARYECVHGRDPFMIGFLYNHFLRPACHRCPYAGIPRIGDLTLGDFWGVAAIDQSLDDDRGTSLVLGNTDQGRAALDGVAHLARVSVATLDRAIAGNPNLVRSVEPSSVRGAFFESWRAGHGEFGPLVPRFLRPVRPRFRDVLVGLVASVPLAVRVVRWGRRLARRGKAHG